MRFEWGYLIGMALQTVPEPRKIARELFALNFPRGVLWQMFLVLQIMSAALGVLAGMLFPVQPDMAETIFGQPLIVALAETMVGVVTIFLIFWLGRSAGGTGTFEQAQTTVVWLNFVLFIVQVGVLILTLFAPSMALLLWAAGGVMGFWVLSHFTAESHGFQSALRVFGAILLTSFVAVAILSIVLTLIGVGAGVATGDLGNV